MIIFVIIVELWNLAMIETLIDWALFAFLVAGAMSMLWITIRGIIEDWMW